VRAHLQRAVADRADAHAPQADHRVADGIAHVAHLPGLSLVDRDRQQRLVGPGAQSPLQDPHYGRRRPLALDAHAAAHPVQGVLGRLAAHAGVILPLHLVAGMQETFGEGSVVGQQEQAFRVVVEAAHRVDVLADVGQQVEDRLPLFRVLPRRDVPSRLVQQDVAMTRRDANPLAVHADVVPAGVGPRAELQHRGAVHRDAALRDERLGGAPRRHARGGEDLLKPFAGWVVSHLVSASLRRRGLTSP
jgi:hypothetical protein